MTAMLWFVVTLLRNGTDYGAISSFSNSGGLLPQLEQIDDGGHGDGFATFVARAVLVSVALGSLDIIHVFYVFYVTPRR